MKQVLCGIDNREAHLKVCTELQQLASTKQRDSDAVVPQECPVRRSEVLGVESPFHGAGHAHVMAAHTGVLDHEVGVGRSPDSDRHTVDRDELARVPSREHRQRGARMGGRPKGRGQQRCVAPRGASA